MGDDVSVERVAAMPWEANVGLSSTRVGTAAPRFDPTVSFCAWRSWLRRRVLFLKKGPAIGDGLQSIRGYFSEVLIELNLAFRVVPTPLTTAMIARAIPAAIKPYSMAVAADSSRTKRAKSLVICDSRERKWQGNA